jgi:hypothetical protein
MPTDEDNPRYKPTTGKPAAKPSTVNDPDNPNAARNAPPATSRPGFQQGDTLADYDEWWNTNKTWVSEFMYLNPERAGEVKGLLWQFRFADGETVTNAFMQRGLTLGQEDDGGGGRGSGGGGGGANIAQQYVTAEAAVRNRAGLLGLTFDDAAISSIARAVVDGNWSADQLDDYLVPAARNTNQAGFITATVNKVSQLAAQQLLNVSDATAREWAVKIASGEMDFEGVQSLLQAQASQRFGWAADRIAQGISVRDLLLPTRDRIAAELEMNPEDIDLMDDRWMGMVQTVGADGVTRAATDSEAIMRARKLPEFAQTQKAGDMMATYALTLRDYFGG